MLIDILNSLPPYTPNLLMIMIGMVMIYYFNKNENTPFNAYDYLIDPITNKASISRTLQMIAGLTGTWVITIMASNKTLTVDFFSMYLVAMGLSEAFGKFLGAKYPNSTPTDTNK